MSPVSAAMALKRGNLFISPMPLRQPNFPTAPLLILKQREDAILVSGDTTTQPAHEVNTPSMLYEDVRKDLARMAEITITRSAMRFHDHVYTGVIDSEGTPYYFALSSTGLAMKKAEDTERAWTAFDAMADHEHQQAVRLRRLESVVEQDAFVAKIDPALVVSVEKSFVLSKAERHTGVMVALQIPRKLARKIALPDGEPPETMHITLAYLGKDLTDDQKLSAEHAVRCFARRAGRITAVLGGVGRFSASQTSEGKDVIYLSVDSPDITRLRHELVQELAAEGLAPSTAHGFVPHVTLSYVDTDAKMPIRRVEPRPVAFDVVSLFLGEHVTKFPLVRPSLTVAKGMRAKGPGSRGSKKLWFDKHGKPRYDDRPMLDKHVGVTLHDDHGMDGGDSGMLRHIKRAKPATVADLKQTIYDHCVKQGDTKVEATGYVKDWLHALHDNGAVSLNLDPMHEEETGELRGKLEATRDLFADRKGEKNYKTQRGLAPPLLRKMTSASQKLVVSGRPISVSPDVAAACLAYAKRFIVNDGDVARRATWDKNFHKWLQDNGVPKGNYDFRQFVAAARAEVPKERTKSAEEPTPKTHPHLFVVRDGKTLKLAEAKFPLGNFYTGKDKYGIWARALRPEELIFNGTNPPAGFKGTVINDPTKRFVYAWKHPDTGAWGYVEPVTSKVGAEIEKFARSQKMAKHIESLRDKIVYDIKNSRDMRTKVAALCTYLIDEKKFRAGGEDKVEDHGTFGVGSLRVNYKKGSSYCRTRLEGKNLVVEFSGKKQQPWRRVVDLSKTPEVLSIVKQCLSGKSGDERVWEGEGWRVDDKAINEYLAHYPVDGEKITTKDFRTFHANAYVREMLPKLEAVEKAFDLKPADTRKLLEGFVVSDKRAAHLKALLGQSFKGTTVREYLGFVDYDDGKKRKLGLIPTVATHLGHTDASSRGSYIDPVTITAFAAKRGWDARKPKEKRTRTDLAFPAKK